MKRRTCPKCGGSGYIKVAGFDSRAEALSKVEEIKEQCDVGSEEFWNAVILEGCSEYLTDRQLLGIF